MATLLDTSLLSYFQFIFPFLLVLVLVYALFAKIKIFKSQNVMVFLAFLFAVIFSFSTIARETINTAAPWLVVLFFFIIMSLVSFMALGASGDDIHGILTGGKYNYIHLWVIALLLIIMIGSLTSVVAKHGGVGNVDTQSSNYTSGEAVASSGQESDFWASLANPKVLGMIFILLVSMFTIQRLTKD